MPDPSRREVERLADQLRRACEGAAWHGPAVFELLAGVTATQAAAQPLPNAHTIWEIVLHLKAWQDVAYRRLNGVSVELTDEEDWPAAADAGPAAWDAARDALRHSYRTLYDAITRLTDARLDEDVPGQSYSVYFLLHGVVQHNLYHAGQIAFLKKRWR